MRRLVLTAALFLLAAQAVRADFNAEVTTVPGFTDGLKRVAVIAVACHESVDCTQVEDAAAEELANLKPPFEIVPPGELRNELFARGATTLSEERALPSWRSSVSTASSRSASPSRAAATASAAAVVPRSGSRSGWSIRMAGRKASCG